MCIFWNFPHSQIYFVPFDIFPQPISQDESFCEVSVLSRSYELRSNTRTNFFDVADSNLSFARTTRGYIYHHRGVYIHSMQTFLGQTTGNCTWCMSDESVVPVFVNALTSVQLMYVYVHTIGYIARWQFSKRELTRTQPYER